MANDYRGADDIPFVAHDQMYIPVDCSMTTSRFCQLPYYYPITNRMSDT
jgi:hypothetical protein